MVNKDGYINLHTRAVHSVSRRLLSEPSQSHKQTTLHWVDAIYDSLLVHKRRLHMRCAVSCVAMASNRWN